jgi:hypothetical protein
MVVRLPGPTGALQPGRHQQPGPFPPARLHPIHAAAVVAGAGEPRVRLEVLQRGVIGLLQDLLHALLPAAPQHLACGITSQMRPAGLLAERRV